MAVCLPLASHPRHGCPSASQNQPSPQDADETLWYWPFQLCVPWILKSQWTQHGFGCFLCSLMLTPLFCLTILSWVPTKDNCTLAIGAECLSHNAFQQAWTHNRSQATQWWRKCRNNLYGSKDFKPSLQMLFKNIDSVKVVQYFQTRGTFVICVAFSLLMNKWSNSKSFPNSKVQRAKCYSTYPIGISSTANISFK